MGGLAYFIYSMLGSVPINVPPAVGFSLMLVAEDSTLMYVRADSSGMAVKPTVVINVN